MKDKKHIKLKKRWKTIPGWGGFYDVNNMGEVRSWHVVGGRDVRAKHPHILKPPKGNVYFRVTLRYAGRVKRYYVHSLVLLAFRGPCSPGGQAIHKDESRNNNQLSNLRWGPHKENCGMQLHRERISKAAKLRYQNPEAQKKASASHPVGKSGYRGVVKHNRKWRAQIGINGKMVTIGPVYDTPCLAALAFDAYIHKHKLPRMTNKERGLL